MIWPIVCHGGVNNSLYTLSFTYIQSVAILSKSIAPLPTEYQHIFAHIFSSQSDRCTLEKSTKLYFPNASNFLVPSTPLNQLTRSLMNCSICGLNFVSCRLKSSTVPILRMLWPGKASPTRYMSVPHVEQK